jgi:hypothetical protein
MVNLGQNEVGLPKIQFWATKKSHHSITLNLAATETNFNGHIIVMTEKNWVAIVFFSNNDQNVFGQKLFKFNY